MSGKVLLNVYSLQVKNDLLSIFVQNGYDVFETLNEHDLLFKHNLIRDELDIYVHELDEMNYNKSLDQLKRIDRDKVRCIVMIHKYASNILDDALALKVKDVIVLPMDSKNLTSKLIVPTQAVKRTTLMPKEPPKQVEQQTPIQAPIEVEEEAKPAVNGLEAAFSQGSLDMELNRATRGKYPLSLVMVAYSGMGDEVFNLFEESLSHLLRTTDEILRYDRDLILLLCPFTTKENRIEVENKVRQAYQSLTFNKDAKGDICLQGVTYPREAVKSDQLLKVMVEGIQCNKGLSEVNHSLNQLDSKEVRERLRKNY